MSRSVLTAISDRLALPQLADDCAFHAPRSSGTPDATRNAKRPEREPDPLRVLPLSLWDPSGTHLGLRFNG